MQNQLPRSSSRWTMLLAAAILMIVGPGCEILNQVQSNAEPSPTAAVARVVPTIGNQPTQPTVAPGTAPKNAPPTETLAPTFAPPKSKSLKMNSPEYGAQAFLWWRPETADRDLGLMRDAGLTWVKQIFAWQDIEGASKGAYNWVNADQAVNTANAKGIDMLARLDNAPNWAAPGCNNPAKKQMGPAKNTQDWLDFLQVFVTRYKGKIRAYEIWNEPNLSREWCGRPPNPGEYAALLKASYGKIKSIDPNAMIVSAGLTPTTQNNSEAMPDSQYVEQMYAAMGNKSDGYFDVLGVHAPGFHAPPEISPDDIAKNAQYNHGEGAAGRVYGFRHTEDIRKIMVAKGDSAKQIAILEFGWTSDTLHPAYSWFQVDDQTKGRYIVGAYKFAKANWSPWIGAMFVIYMSNPDWTKDTEEYWWAITEPDGTPRAGYVQIKNLAK